MKILLALIIISSFAYAEEWALVDSSGTVKTIIVADAAHIATRTDGNWVKTITKVGRGWNHSTVAKTFTPKVAAVDVSTEAKVIEWTKY